MRQRLEYAAAWPFIKILGILPRPLARAIGMGLAWVVYLLHVRLRQVGMRNLAMAFPEKTKAERARILRGEFSSLGRQLAEVCHFPKYTLKNVDDVVVYDGFENYERAHAGGKGVLLFDRDTLGDGSFPPLFCPCMGIGCTWSCAAWTTSISTS